MLVSFFLSRECMHSILLLYVSLAMPHMGFVCLKIQNSKIRLSIGDILDVYVVNILQS